MEKDPSFLNVARTLLGGGRGRPSLLVTRSYERSDALPMKRGPRVTNDCAVVVHRVAYAWSVRSRNTVQATLRQVSTKLSYSLVALGGSCGAALLLGPRWTVYVARSRAIKRARARVPRCSRCLLLQVETSWWGHCGAKESPRDVER